jgi:hypothetical protein
MMQHQRSRKFSNLLPFKSSGSASLIGFVTATLLLSPLATYAKPISLSPGFTPNPVELAGTAKGSVAIASLSSRANTPTGECTGFTNTKPNHTVVLTEFFNTLSVEVTSEQDTALMIKGPGGVWCNDDFQGKNPGITGQWLPGTYQIWVSVYSQNRTAPYTLRFMETR